MPQLPMTISPERGNKHMQLRQSDNQNTLKEAALVPTFH